MHIKIFEAETMNQALLQIKREFGPDAVILSARSVRGGLLKGRRVEVTAATDGPTVTMPSARRSAAAASPANPATLDFPAPRPWQAVEAYRMKPSERKHDAGRPAAGPSRDTAPRSQATTTEDPENIALRRHLIHQGVGRRLARELAENPALLKSAASPEDSGPALAAAMAECGLACERIRIRRGRATVAAMVGPPGVGKTTAVVKLAALARNRLGAGRVGIIAVDNTRQGAVEQLLNFAAVVGVEARVVRKPVELSRVLGQFRKMALVLVDTAGVSAADRHGVLGLKNFFQRCRRRVEMHLLLAASTKGEDMCHMVEGFGPLAFERLLFTRVDETCRHGNLLNIMDRTQIPVSYFSQGQRIPDDLKIATLEKLAGLVLGDWTSGTGERPDESEGPQWMTG